MRTPTSGATLGLGLVLCLLPGSVRAAGADDDPFAFLGELGRVVVATERYYVEPVERSKLLEGALRGMVGKLDPHTAYLDAREYQELVEETEGQFGGIGVEVDVRGDMLTVIAPIEGGPAERAGIRSGDRILSVDGLNIEQVGLDKVVKHMRGAPGTVVTLVVRATEPPSPEPGAPAAPGATPAEDGKPGPGAKPGEASKSSLDPRVRVVKLTREIIRVSSVTQQLLKEGVGYLRLKQFQGRTHTELVEAVAALRREQRKNTSSPALRGILLDLRSNPGGLVDQAVAVADEFLEGGTVLTMRSRGRVVEDLRATSGGVLSKEPVVVLVNEWSASAAEILAGALQDTGRALIVGVDTFGKGSVQTVLELPAGSALKLTTARYYTPKGHAVQADAIHPDVIAAAVPTGATPPLPITRERDLPGRLEGDGATRAPSAPPRRQFEGEPGSYLVPRKVPADPRVGDDGALKIAYEALLERIEKAPAGSR